MVNGTVAAEASIRASVCLRSAIEGDFENAQLCLDRSGESLAISLLDVGCLFDSKFES